jgi:polynucleotide 5'-kinase involved in rRNA processing
VNVLGDNINIVNKNTEIVIDDSEEVGLKVNIEKTKYILLSCHNNVGQYHGIKIVNRSFKNMAQLKDMGTRAANQNLNQE